MTNFRTVLLAALIGVLAGVAIAQPGSGKGPGPGSGPMGPGPAASAPAMGMGMGIGPGGGHGAGRWGPDDTPGWAMMTQQERNEHHARMRSMKTHEECQAYQTQHHEQMAARAKERGGKALAQPKRDACSGLKK